MIRNPKIQNLINDFTKMSFGRTQTEAKSQNVCVICGKDANYFKDEISRKEYSLSGLCQKCQDEVFK